MIHPTHAARRAERNRRENEARTLTEYRRQFRRLSKIGRRLERGPAAPHPDGIANRRLFVTGWHNRLPGRNPSEMHLIQARAANAFRFREQPATRLAGKKKSKAERKKEKRMRVWDRRRAEVTK